MNLATGAAIGVAGGVANIRDVRGGDFGDTLIGNAQGKALIGGADCDLITGGGGRSLLIEGAGADVLQAGSGGDILIGGTTSYDSSAFANNTALDQILNEWQSDVSYAARIATIRDSVGPGGAYRLAFDSAVADDSAANQLYGGSGMDWFFQGPMTCSTTSGPASRSTQPVRILARGRGPRRRQYLAVDRGPRSAVGRGEC
jgi:Ca2+-binding RTX toxin-like protein